MNKKILSVAIAGAMAAPMTAQAVKYKLSGQVNRAVVFQDDGVQSDVRNVDSISSGTRFRFKGSEDLGNGMKVGMYYELQTSSSASQQNFPDRDSDGADGLNIRQANVWFSGHWGKLTIGQHDGAGNGSTESDLSGTLISGAGASKNSFSGGLAWRLRSGGASIGLTEGQTYNNFDAFSRYDALRYDSPSLGPVVLSASLGNDQTWEGAARVNTAIGGGQLSAAAFYGSSTGSRNIDNRWGGSLSYLFSQGTNITGHYAQNDPENGTDSDSWSVKLGHKWGPHAVSINYGQAEDVGGAGFEDTGIQIGYVHSLKKANTQLYASFSHNELDTPAGVGSVEDHNIFLVGARVKFD